ncbi:MAG: response regulator transcription factor [Pedosphaera sp.]|nr:response regulator transcription factor [Pedosphaera sp.]
MENPACATVENVLILKADRLYAEMLRQHIHHEFPAARITIVASVEAAARVLAAGPNDFLITGLGAPVDGDVLDLLVQHRQRRTGTRRVFVVTARREYRVLAALKSLSIEGVFDSAAEPPVRLAAALQVVARGALYWSPSIVDHLRRVGSASNAWFRMLTAFEQVVLSVVGGGCDDAMAAQELGLSPATVSTVRRELHRKLGVQHRGELVRVAAQQGFVRFTPTGVVRPGFALLSAAYEARRTKRPGVVSPVAAKMT